MIINMLTYFEATAAEKSQKVAVIDGEETILFETLRKKARVLGTYLLKQNAEAMNRPVAVFIEKSIDCVTADLGIMYSGNAYMNLDIKTPMQRISNILALVQPAFLLTNTKQKHKLAGIVDAEKLIDIDELALYLVDDAALASRQRLLIDTDPLCLINTSGSTGTPKSVILNHRSFIDFTEWAIDTTGIGDDEVIGSLSPVVFDIYSFELCMLMTKSSTIVVIPDSFTAFPAKILQLMQKHGVSFIFWVPTIMVNIANMNLLSKITVPSLKMVWFAGEVFPTKQFNCWRHKMSGVRFVNLYGPIEITLDCTYYIVEREIADEESIPIGYPCRNTDILLLKEDNSPAEDGVEGELCVRGTSLAMGYYNNPEKTAAAFVQNPLNHVYPELIYRTGDLAYRNERGELIFRGRRDSLVKHAGYRIELGEIEHVIINTLQIVKNGCIVYDFEHKEIVFYYEPEKDMSVGDIRRSIGTALPKYMIPTRFIAMEELPRNTNGKIDRLKLKKMATEA